MAAADSVRALQQSLGADAHLLTYLPTGELVTRPYLTSYDADSIAILYGGVHDDSGNAAAEVWITMEPSTKAEGAPTLQFYVVKREEELDEDVECTYDPRDVVKHGKPQGPFKHAKSAEVLRALAKYYFISAGVDLIYPIPISKTFRDGIANAGRVAQKRHLSVAATLSAESVDDFTRHSKGPSGLHQGQMENPGSNNVTVRCDSQAPTICASPTVSSTSPAHRASVEQVQNQPTYQVSGVIPLEKPGSVKASKGDDFFAPITLQACIPKTEQRSNVPARFNTNVQTHGQQVTGIRSSPKASGPYESGKPGPSQLGSFNVSKNTKSVFDGYQQNAQGNSAITRGANGASVIPNLSDKNTRQGPKPASVQDDSQTCNSNNFDDAQIDAYTKQFEDGASNVRAHEERLRSVMANKSKNDGDILELQQRLESLEVTISDAAAKKADTEKELKKKTRRNRKLEEEKRDIENSRDQAQQLNMTRYNSLPTSLYKFAQAAYVAGINNANKRRRIDEQGQ